MDSGDQINITVILGGRPYPMTLEASEEEVIRRIARELNDRIHHFQLKYARIDKQDAMAMALLVLARELELSKQDHKRYSNLRDALGDLDLFLDSLLDETA